MNNTSRLAQYCGFQGPQSVPLDKLHEVAADRIRRLEDYIRRYRYHPSLPDRDLENARQKFIDKLLEEYK